MVPVYFILVWLTKLIDLATFKSPGKIYFLWQNVSFARNDGPPHGFQWAVFAGAYFSLGNSRSLPFTRVLLNRIGCLAPTDLSCGAYYISGFSNTSTGNSSGAYTGIILVFFGKLFRIVKKMRKIWKPKMLKCTDGSQNELDRCWVLSLWVLHQLIITSGNTTLDSVFPILFSWKVE